jgi:hypothetical protein
MCVMLFSGGSYDIWFSKDAQIQHILKFFDTCHNTPEQVDFIVYIVLAINKYLNITL